MFLVNLEPQDLLHPLWNGSGWHRKEGFCYRRWHQLWTRNNRQVACQIGKKRTPKYARHAAFPHPNHHLTPISPPHVKIYRWERWDFIGKIKNSNISSSRDPWGVPLLVLIFCINQLLAREKSWELKINFQNFSRSDQLLTTDIW